VLCGLKLVDRIPEVGLPRARVGLHTGPVVFQNGDYFGRTVAVRYEPVSPVTLKGLTAPITLSTAARAD
jgi:hypothetical protein